MILPSPNSGPKEALQRVLSFRAEAAAHSRGTGSEAAEARGGRPPPLMGTILCVTSPLLKRWHLSNCRSQALTLVIRPGLEKAHTISSPPPPGVQGAEECSVYLSLS